MTDTAPEGSPRPQGKGANPFDRPYPLLALFREHPAMALTSAYLAASFVGVLFSFAFYRELEVNFFNFADVSDLLMAMLREPVTFLLAAGAMVVGWLFRRYYRLEWEYFQRHPPKFWLLRQYYRLSRWNYATVWSDVVAIAAYALLFIVLYGEWKAEQVRAGHGADRVWLELESSRREVMLLGATSRYVFTWDEAAQTVNVIPAENVRRLVMRSGQEQPRPHKAGQTP